MNSKSKDETIRRRELAKHLLQGKYCRFRMGNHGASVCVVYQGKQEPVRYYSRAVSSFLEHLLKTDAAGRMTLNLNEVRKLHGKSLLKLLYNALKKKP